MTDIAIETPAAEAPKKAPAKKTKRKKATPRKVAAAPKEAKPAHEFAGMTARTCPLACTADRCIISTVGTCKHPSTTSDSGCGPITLRNRERARKYLKHQAIERE